MGIAFPRIAHIVEFALVVLQPGNFTNYTAVDYARKEERVTPVRVRHPWIVFPVRRVLAMLMTAATHEGRRAAAK